jgi:hypothetical protein
MARPKKPKFRRVILPSRPAEATVSCPVEAAVFEMRVYVALMLREDIPSEHAAEHAGLCDWVLARVRAIHEGLTDQEQAEVVALMPKASDYIGPGK